MKTIEIWVEILPAVWPDWNDTPWRLKAGRIRRRPPRTHERHLFTPIRIHVDVADRYGPKSVTV